VGEEASDHLARCSDCWQVLQLLHELASGAPLAEATQMDALFACEPVQQDLYLLAGLSGAEARAGHPRLVAHLRWCLACRDRLVEVLSVEQQAARGEYGPPLFTATVSAWRTQLGRLGTQTHEAAGRLVVGLGRAVAAFTAVPDGFLLVPGAAPAAARGEPSTGAAPGRGAASREVRFPLADTGIWVDLRIEPQGDERVGLTVRFTGGALEHASLHVREVGADDERLIARHTVRGPEPFAVQGLRPGHYLLEIEDKQPPRRFRVRFDVDPSA
jgi:hypothetical protein